MTPRLSGHSFYILPCGLVFFVLKRLLRIARQWSREKFAVLFLKPRSPVRISYVEGGLLMQVWLCPMLLILEVLCFFFFSKCSQKSCFLRQFKYIFYFLSLIKWPKTNSIVFSCFMLQKWLSVVNCKKSKEVNIRTMLSYVILVVNVLNFTYVFTWIILMRQFGVSKEHESFCLYNKISANVNSEYRCRIERTNLHWEKLKVTLFKIIIKNLKWDYFKSLRS